MLLLTTVAVDIVVRLSNLPACLREMLNVSVQVKIDKKT